MNAQAIIEIPQGSIFKYERDKEDGMLSLDRVLNQPIPYNYGYIPNTLCGDGDPLDVFILNDSPIYPLSKVRINIVGVLKCLDNGESDDKLIAVLEGEQVRSSGMAIVQTYLTSYKKGFEILSVGNQAEAYKVYVQSLAEYAKSNEKNL